MDPGTEQAQPPYLAGIHDDFTHPILRPMQVLTRLTERHAHALRWLLLLGWLGLIGSLLLSPWLNSDLIPGRLASCAAGGSCNLHHHDGNRLFWGMVVPLGLLMIVAMSHELWRRLCPLAFVSQLFRALGLQRTGRGPGGHVDVVRVAADSWLGRHHVQLQWSLFIAGLSLRLLVVNSNPFGLGLFLLLTVLAAVIVGWAYGGKAWCQYVCPMGPVQAILIGPRSLLGTPSHWGSGPKLSQSMCRTVSAGGGEKSACVACQTPCLDIDSERSYWQTLRGKRGLTFAWYSYPGIVLAFFLLLQGQGGADHGFLRSGRWAYDTTVLARIWTPWSPSLATATAPSGKPQQPSIAPITRPENRPGARGSQAPGGRPNPPSAQSWPPPRWHNKRPSLLEETVELAPIQLDAAEFGRELPTSLDHPLPAQNSELLRGSRKPGS